MEYVVVVRGGGDLATGVIWRLHRSGFRVICLEAPTPTVIRRTVSAAQAVFDGYAYVEGVRFLLMEPGRLPEDRETVPIWIDPSGRSIDWVKPYCVVDAIMAKRNEGTHIGMAPLVGALGPGFVAGKDVHFVVETLRGHYLGRVIYEGSAIPNTGIPGEIGRETEGRILRSPGCGLFRNTRKIGDSIQAGEIVGYVEDLPVVSRISGMLRGLIHPSVSVTRGMKIGDVDPRNEIKHCFTISDKALAIAGGVLEAITTSLITRHVNILSLFESNVNVSHP